MAKNQFQMHILWFFFHADVQPFCWWMTFTKVSNPFLPSPPKWLTWLLDVCGRVGGRVGYGWFYWFSLRIFSQTSLELEIFSPRYNCVRFFFSIIRHERYFFQCMMFFPGIYLHAFFLPKSACRTLFSEITHNPLKSQMVGP